MHSKCDVFNFLFSLLMGLFHAWNLKRVDNSFNMIIHGHNNQSCFATELYFVLAYVSKQNDLCILRRRCMAVYFLVFLISGGLETF